MTTLFYVSIILLLHFIADFILQSDKIAKTKSKSNKALLQHVCIYTSVMIFVGPLFAIISGILHFCVDYITSRWASYLWNKNDIHNFFVVIGFDQLLHMLMLIWVWYFIGR